MRPETLAVGADDSPFQATFSLRQGLIAGLKRRDDAFDTDYLKGHGLGKVEMRYRTGGGDWQFAASLDSDDVRQVRVDDEDQPRDIVVDYDADSTDAKGIRGFSLQEHFRLDGDRLHWQITLRNRLSEPLEIGDLALPMLFNTDYVRDSLTTYTQRVVRHSHIAGHGSFVVALRPNGVGPFLAVLPDADTPLEYFERTPGMGAWEGVYTAFVHSRASGEAETRGAWRLPHTSRTLQPAGQQGDTAVYRFDLLWADDYEAARQALYDAGLLDIQVVPGMSLPSDLFAQLAIRTRQPIGPDSLAVEFPAQTTVEYLGERAPDIHQYRLHFARLGENRVDVKLTNGGRHTLQFFVTEPVETVIKKRAAFIVAHQQHRRPETWYDGLFSLWDMENRVLRGPDDAGGLHPYMVGGSDDPTLCKAGFVAGKNVHFPVRAEIEAVEYYLEHFVWGGLQRTDTEEPHPYGIYGSDNWYANRTSPIGLNSGGLGQERMWRTFDYTHLILLYFAMYRIARDFPDLVRYLDKAGYLERAFGTARAFFVVPYNIKMGEAWDFRGWCDWAYKQGNFHELVIPALIEALDAEGRAGDAAWLRAEWEKKVKFFVYDHRYPFGSEMYFDTTAFESTHMIARYGLEHPLEPDENLWQDKNTGEWYSHPSVRKEDFRAFMERQIAANIAARGWLETSYFHLGSDIRQHGNSNYQLSYMTQMGGWAILDYALHYAEDAARYARLGYASYLAGWALVNSGTPESNYGFWFPGPENDGATGWAFEPGKYTTNWAGKAQGRGVWSYDGEIDSGFSGGLRTAAVVVVDDPLFGLFAYGGILEVTGHSLVLWPKDGLRQRLHLLDADPALHITLERDGFAAESAIHVQRAPFEIAFTLENRSSGAPHTATLRVGGLPGGRYEAAVGGAVQAQVEVITNAPAVLPLSLGPEARYAVTVRRA